MSLRQDSQPAPWVQTFETSLDNIAQPSLNNNSSSGNNNWHMGSFIHKSKIVETTQIPADWHLGKQTAVSI